MDEIGHNGRNWTNKRYLTKWTKLDTMDRIEHNGRLRTIWTKLNKMLQEQQNRFLESRASMMHSGTFKNSDFADTLNLFSCSL